MKLLLWRDVDKLGRVGEAVEVREGYARNYLLPRQIATIDTPSMRAALEREKKKRQKMEAERVAQARVRAQDLEKLSITLEVRTNDEGHLYGSVTPTMISEALKEKGFEIEPRVIEVADPIKMVGNYEVAVALHSEVKPKLKIWVVSSSAGEPAAGEAPAAEGQAPPAGPAA